MHYIAAEFVEGKTLRDLIDGGLKMRDALAIATQAAEALGAAHQAGVLHRDIKPENILVRPDSYTKVLDFGLAKLSEQATATGESNLSRQETQPGLLMGTLAYMSPEQAAGDEVDQRSDIRSLGVVLYEMMTGTSPTKRANRAETPGAILSNEPLGNSGAHPHLSAELDHILAKALEKDRELRYLTASDFRADLKRLKRELDSSPSHSADKGGAGLPRGRLFPARPWHGRGTFVGQERDDAGIGTYSFSNGSYEKLTDTGGYPIWLKDNRKFIFIEKTTIYLSDIESRKVRPVFSPSLHGLQSPSISPDNRMIFFRFLQVGADVWLLSLE